MALCDLQGMDLITLKLHKHFLHLHLHLVHLNDCNCVIL